MEIRECATKSEKNHAYGSHLYTQDKAFEPSQKYKEGKYILERNLLVDVQ
jgi:hypothetical protein